MGRCCVPGCRGNYDNGPKVRVLSFPKNEGRRQSWIRAIPRKDFTPSIHSKVCELHFQGSELITKLSHFDAASGKTVTVDSERVHLVPDAVPSIFP
ncbi:THAP domain-containing protein 2-like [Amblyomma americanum]